MTRPTNARVAGVTFLLYIAFGILSLALYGQATHGAAVDAKLASVAQHASTLRVTVVLNLLCCFCALVLGVTLWALTRDQDRDLAMLGLTCRVAEGVTGGLGLKSSMALLWLATASGARGPDPAGMGTLGAFFLWGQGGNPAAIFFAVGSTLFAWLFLRGRMIPVPLAWLGVIASIVCVVALPFDVVGVLPAVFAWTIWVPMALFEIVLALWLIFKGASLPARG